MHDIIIIGAGAAGLTAGNILSKAGKRVLILEARSRCGGRMHTLPAGQFSLPVETGAEFIHGDLPETKKLLHAAGQTYHTIGGELWRVERGALVKEDSFSEGADIIMPRLESLETDITIAEFFKKFFDNSLYENLLREIRGYVEGYDAGDIHRASAFALRDEWGEQDNSDQYRPDAGYTALVNWLESEFKNQGGEIICDAIVKELTWKSEGVTAFTGEREYASSAALITVPLGILQASPEATAAIKMDQLPESYRHAISSLGYGAVIKILFEFKSSFWEGTEVLANTGADLQNLGWLFSTEEVPTWWTQIPNRVPVLTGWLAGPRAKAMSDLAEEEVIARALQSLSSILHIPLFDLREKLVASAVFNWTADPFTLGAYAYSTPETKDALKILKTPIDNTIFFAGEAFHDGPQMGTVEGAIISGQDAAKLLLT